jgi:phospholipid/cholesterol/gamma-HCH transport system substrate-binding protein
VPSEKQVRWSQLRVGITVLVALITLAVLILLMTGTTGLFTMKIILRAYVDDAGGLRTGAPVRLEGVDIGNVVGIRVVPDAQRRAAPVEILMKTSTKYEDSMTTGCQASLATAGVLGEVYINIDCRSVRGGAPLQNNAELQTQQVPQLEDVVRASQGTLQNVNVLVKQLSDILDYIQSGKGSIGKIIYDSSLYDRANATLSQLQKVADEINSPQGSLGKILNSDELYVKVNTAIDNLNKVIDEANSGQGTIGKFLKDPSLYNNANKMVANGNQLVADINAGKGTLGKLAKDQAMANKIDDTVTRLDNITTGLDKGEGTAGKLLKDPKLYDNTNDLLVETRDLIKAVRQNPKKYLTIYLKIF